MATEHKEQKVITMNRELRMRREASEAINELEAEFPEAREIDILNAFLRSFTERNDSIPSDFSNDPVRSHVERRDDGTQ